MLNVVILAAGLGKRMQSNLPKVMHQIAGKPMLGHVLDSARALSPDRIVVVVGYGAEQVEAAFGEDTGLVFALQQPQHGTGHAVLQAVPLLTGTNSVDDVTLVLYGDVPLVKPTTLASLLMARGKGMAVLTEHLADATGYGRIVRNTQGQVQCIVEHKDATETERTISEVNTGIMCVPTNLLKQWLSRLSNDNAQKEFYLTDVVGFAVKDGVPVGDAQPATDSEMLGVNSRIQQAILERIYQREQADRLLEAGVTLADPGRFDLRGNLTHGRDVAIDVGCVFEGAVHLADGVRIGPHCVLRDVALGVGTVVEAFSHLHGAKVAEDSRIGPYARLRPGSKLDAATRVGNFVEIKASIIGKGSKVNHLAYLGDAIIGARVNIGAGTITCNYDGLSKHRTIIEDDVFIGSDTQLVAPITVGEGSTVGAGTTLTQDVRAGTLTLSRVPQFTKENWYRPDTNKAK